MAACPLTVKIRVKLKDKKRLFCAVKGVVMCGSEQDTVQVTVNNTRQDDRQQMTIPDKPKSRNQKYIKADE